jgi:hypothetical protein
MADTATGTQKQQELDDRYCFHYYLPITHSVDNIIDHKHSHTLEITTYIRLLSGFEQDDIQSRSVDGKQTRSREKFGEIEKFASEFLKRYEGQYLNSLNEFGGDASIEHVGDVIYAAMSEYLLAKQLFLERLEIGENPLRVYVVSTYL